MHLISSGSENANLFWTGGWDSTFALLRIVLEYKLPVIPFYLVDDNRKSTGIEIQTMERIREKISFKYPPADSLIAPTRYFNVSEIPPDREIEGAFKRIREKKHLGTQYEWLAGFCRHNSLHGIAMGLEKQSADYPDYPDLSPFLIPESRGLLRSHCINPKYRKSDVYILFHYFSFPVIDVTKTQMLDIAREKGWEELMRLTWSCLNPAGLSRGKTAAFHCGVCLPCLLLQAEGIGWRISCGRRLISLFYWFCARPIEKTIKLILSKAGLLEKTKMLLKREKPGL